MRVEVFKERLRFNREEWEGWEGEMFAFESDVRVSQIRIHEGEKQVFNVDFEDGEPLDVTTAPEFQMKVTFLSADGKREGFQIPDEGISLYRAEEGWTNTIIRTSPCSTLYIGGDGTMRLQSPAGFSPELESVECRFWEEVTNHDRHKEAAGSEGEVGVESGAGCGEGGDQPGALLQG